jgi:chromosome segregation ATPase
MDTRKDHVKRLRLLVVGIALLLSPFAIMAQRGAGRGGRSAGAGPASAPTTDPTVASVSRAIAAQATKEQQGQFQSAAQSADTAIKLAESLQAGLAKADESFNYSEPLKALEAALDRTKREDEAFLQGFSKIQASEWKDSIKTLKKAAGDVDSKWKAFNRSMERGKNGRQKLSEGATELLQALANLRRQQQALGANMGIQS